MIQEAIQILVKGESITSELAAKTMKQIMEGDATPAQFGAFVTALRIKGETVEEVVGMAQVMREKSLSVKFDGPLVDTCGTGGDGHGTFNVSTTAAFVVAGTGITVAKHGNRAMSGTCGSADVLEAMGVNIDLSPDGVEQCLDKVGFGFMFAQRYHPSMRFASGPRKEIGIRTVFNILGPLTNPAGATAQLIGVADPSFGEIIAKALGVLGSTHALVVHGMDGLDEITLSDETYVWEFKEGNVSSYKISPEDLGFERIRPKDLRASNLKESIKMITEVLGGWSGPARNVILSNAAAALVAYGSVLTIKEGITVAAKSIDSGEAKRKLEALVELSGKLE